MLGLPSGLGCMERPGILVGADGFILLETLRFS